MYSCEIDDLTDRKILETINTSDNTLTLSSDHIGDRNHLYRIRIAATVNGQKYWGPSKTFENVDFSLCIPKII